MSVTRFRDAWGALGAIFGLIALYLLLVHFTAVTQILQTLFASGGALPTNIKTLQGRG